MLDWRRRSLTELRASLAAETQGNSRGYKGRPQSCSSDNESDQNETSILGTVALDLIARKKKGTQQEVDSLCLRHQLREAVIANQDPPHVLRQREVESRPRRFESY